MAKRSTFTSKVDRWLVGLMIGATALGGVAIVLVIVQQSAGYGLVAVVSIGVPAVVLPLWVLWRTDYTLTDEALLVRSGPLRWSVRLLDIRMTQASRSGLSGPALSLDRLCVDHGPGCSLLISPREAQRFQSQLLARQRMVAGRPS